jgi:hypothetical protein
MRATVHAGAVLQSRNIFADPCGVVAGTAVAAHKRKRLRDQRAFWVQCEVISQMQNKPMREIGIWSLTSGWRCYLRAAESVFTVGRGDMANRLRFVAACFPSLFLMLFLMSGLTDARAADPGFCRQFAKAAIRQVRGALADPRCGAGVQGARWSTDFAAHYEWCLGAPPDAAGADRDARTRFLRACTNR